MQIFLGESWFDLIRAHPRSLRQVFESVISGANCFLPPRLGDKFFHPAQVFLKGFAS
jgi:hypothetical protein